MTGAELRQYADSHGPNYSTATVRREKEQAVSTNIPYELPDDPWDTRWTPTDVRSIFVGVGGQSLYDRSYRHTSEWVHWGPRAILSAMTDTEEELRDFSREDWRSAAEALVLGCQSLIQSLQALDEHFALGLGEPLTALLDQLEGAFPTGIRDPEAMLAEA